MNKHFCLTSALVTLLAPAIASAQTQIGGIATSVSGGLSEGFGSGGFVGLVMFLRERVLLIIYPVGVFMLVRAGLKLINSQDEDKLNKAKRTIAATVVGIMMAHLSLKLVDAFFFVGGALAPGAGANILSVEIAGILNWVTTLMAVIAILMIVASAIRAVASFGKEDGTTQIRQTIYGTVLGIGMIVTSGAIKLSLGLAADASAVLPGFPSPGPVIIRGIGITIVVLSFMALIALGVIIYAGMLMVANLGNDEQYNKAKGIITRAVIGLVVILLSSVLMFFVLNLFS